VNDQASPLATVPALPLAGVRVLEVASHVFVPAASALLAEWGAEVVKVEHPETGDAYRGLVTAGLHRRVHGVDVQFQQANRSKDSVGIDLSTEEGQALLHRLAADADVFLTSHREGVRRRLGIELEEIRRANPTIVYVRGSGYGPEGPDADQGAYDHAAYWARTGMAARMAGDGDPQPPPPAFGDYAAALALAAGVASALYRRATTGEPVELDVSLLGAGLWQLQPDVVDGVLDRAIGDDSSTNRRPRTRFDVVNPLVGMYRTADGRHVSLVMIEADRHWADLCERLGVPELRDDPRFADAGARRANSRACVEALDAVFATRSLDDWCRALDGATGVWAPVRRPDEVAEDPQVQSNGYVSSLDLGGGNELPVVTSPVRFGGRPGIVRRAPEVGEHTEDVLLRSGLGWDEITALKDAGAIT
jgi:crotonobetainyl-CoA:carnitine CoA-transferase CaiB-like acyl-CoA transferase